MNKLCVLLISALLIGGCEFRPDTSGVYYKSSNQYPTECKQVSEYRINCRSNGVAK